MRKHLILFILAAMAAAPLHSREVTTLKDGWSYKSMQQKDWVPFVNVTLPHTWNAEYLDGTKDYNRETMVYRRSLPEVSALEGKRAFLYFEGANSVATVFVNRKYVTEHLGGYTAFCCEITDYLKEGENSLEVWVSNAFRSDVPPLTGDFNIYGGLHRPVHLIVTGQDCIDPCFFASPGVLIRQNDISASKAEFTVSTLVSAIGGKAAEVRTTVFNADGSEVCSGTAAVTGESADISFKLAGPRLWNGRKDPYLYTVKSELLDAEGKVLDCVEQKTGFRFLGADPDRGFLLNGNPYPLNGICRHEYFAGKGSALEKEDYELDMKLLLDVGATALRLAHYPHADYEFELCDGNGLVLWSEIPMCGPGGYMFTGSISSEAFRNNTRQALREMIYQKFNHPSACFWSLFNELIIGGDRCYDDAEAFVSELNAICKEADPSRLTTFASAEGLPNFLGCADVIGINMYPGWYFNSEPISLGEGLDKTHREFPDQCLAISEYGAGASIHHHAFPDKDNLDENCWTMVNPSGHWHPEEVQSTVIEDDWQAFGGRKYLWGTFLWLFQDFKSDIRDEGDCWGMNDKGIVTEDRKVLKDSYYFFKAQWNPEPMVYITSRRWTERDWDQAYVKVYTNMKQATLFVNGEKIGTEKPDTLHRISWWDITLKEGDNEIKVVGRDGRKEEITDSCTWTYTKPAEEFPEYGEPYAVTEGPHEHLLANYFGISSWSPDGRYVAVLETDLKDRISEAGEYCTVGLVDLQDGNRFIPIARTCTWNFQEAAMVHWLPGEENTLIYNDMREGKFVSVILDWKTGKERIIPYPVSAVSSDGKWAVSINYARLRLCRPDYGYAGGGQTALENDAWPDTDGLRVVNLETGESRMIVSIASLKDRMTSFESPEGLAYFCHTVFNKDASRIFWLARTVERDAEGNAWGTGTTAFTCNADGSDVRRCFPDGWGGSHFNWLDNDTMVVTCNWENKLYGHVMFTVGEEDKVEHIGAGEIDWDGHCIFSPDGKYVSTDGYFEDWNGYNRTWKLLRLSDGAVKLLGYYYVPEEYRNDWTRCDLHPRFRPDGSQIAFNSVHEGSRQVYLRDIMN